jgi:D-glycero-D-manno-heptose 1,7-bisphosphate phosphatase
VISNQAGVAKGLYTHNDLAKITHNMLKEVKKAGAKIHSVYYCTHCDEDNCNCRKPKTGLFYQASDGLEVDFSDTFFIGDANRDMVAGKRIGCKTIFVLSGMHKIEDLEIQPDFVAANLLEAANIIVGECFI